MLYLIRYGEIALKSKKVRRRFEKILFSNIKTSLKCKFRLQNIYGRFLLEADENVDPYLKKIFGIVSFSECFKTGSDLDSIKKLSLDIATSMKGKTFAVRCNRVGSHQYTSKDIEIDIGSLIVENFGNMVNLSKPEKTLWIDIRNKDAYMYTSIVKGPGGLPVGTAGKVFCLVENFNDIIACWMFMKRGCEVIFSGEKDYLDYLKKWSSGRELIFDAGDIESILEKKNCVAAVKGSLNPIKENFPVPTFNPLVGFDDKRIKKLKTIINNE